MANPAVTYTFVNSTVADASQVNQNFTDIINGLTDGTKSLNIDALTVAGAFTANGSVDLGNAASDTISMTGYVDTNLTIKSTDAGATAGPDIIIDRDSASAADSDLIGRIVFRGNDDAGTPADNDYASIDASIVDSGAGSEDGQLIIKTCVGGTLTERMTIKDTEIVINEDSNDVDFRIEGNGDANLFVCDAGNDRIGVGISAPTDKVEVYQSAPSGLVNGLRFNTNSSGGYSQKIVWYDNWSGGSGLRAGIYGYANGAANKGDLRLQTGNGTSLVDRIIVDFTNGDLRPATDNALDCGMSSYRWNDVYATNGTIQTSDRNQKDEIERSDLGLDFINKLIPSKFKRTGGKRIHYGLIAQDVEQSLEGKDFAGLIKSPMENDGVRYGLRYDEFIAPLIAAIQELKKEVDELKARL